MPEPEPVSVSDDIKERVIKEYNDALASAREHEEIVEDYHNYIASYEYEKSLHIESVCEEIEAYTNARGNYYELILFYLQMFLQSFNYKKYVYLRFYNNIKSDPYYADGDDVNDRNLVATLRNSKLQEIFTNNYKTKETLAIFSDVITKRIKDNFVFFNYYRNTIKHPYIYKSSIYNYLLRDMAIDYTSVVDTYLRISPCEYDELCIDVYDDAGAADVSVSDIYRSIDFETFVDMSFVIKYYAEHFSRDGSKTLRTFYTDTMKSLVIPELYKTFLDNIKKSKNMYNVYEKTKYSYTFDMKEEMRHLQCGLCPNRSGLLFVLRCNYVNSLWRMIFNNTNHYYYYYPEKKSISRIHESIILSYKKLMKKDM